MAMVGNSDSDPLDEQAEAIARLKKEVAQCAIELEQAALILRAEGHPQTASSFANAAARAKASAST